VLPADLAAELRGTGVTVNACRPGGVDTAMQAWIRRQDPERIGAGLHERFNRNYAEGALITPRQSAAVLLDRLVGDDTGAVWTSRPPPLTREAAAPCGRPSAASSRTAPRCCSPPSTSTRPTSWPTGSPSSTTAG
jgi:NAD(P)-dependent dehydrogenase (short-subunit alcohol dehydrogenase family)